MKKLREAWEDTTEKSQMRKKALSDNFSSWEIFETQKVENHKNLDLAGNIPSHLLFDKLRALFFRRRV